MKGGELYANARNFSLSPLSTVDGVLVKTWQPGAKLVKFRNK